MRRPVRIARFAATPIATRGFRQRLSEALCLFIVAACCVVLAWSQTRSSDLLDLESGAVVLSATGEYDLWPALALLDGNPYTGWASRRGRVNGNVIVLELPYVYALESIAFDNNRAQEIDFPGVSARDVEVWLSTRGPDDGYRLAARVQATRGGREQFPLPLGSEARWIKLVIDSNWGSEQFTELMELEAYGSPVGAVPTPQPVSGTYLTNFGPLYLEQSGDLVRGCYDDGTAVVSGRLDGRMMRLDWRESSGSGSALLTVSAGGDFLNGLWYEDAELRGTWRGPRDPGNPHPPCEIGKVAWSED
jgi:hypothetical protein